MQAISRKKNNHYAFHAWTIFYLCAIFYFYKFILQVSPDAMSADLKQVFSVNDYHLGLLSAAFFLVCTFMQIPVGILLDRFGPHKLLTLACLVCATSSMLFAIAPHFAIATIARLFMGAASAFVFLGSLKLITQWFPSQRFSLLNGLLNSLGMLGAMVGEAPLDRLITATGWRHSMLILSGVGFIIALCIFLVVKNRPNGNAIINQPKTEELKKDLACIFKNKQLWLVAIFISMLSIPYIVITNLYGIPFFTTAYPIDSITAARMVSLILLGIGIGGPIWGIISDHLKRRLPPLYIAAIAPPILLALIIYEPFTNLFLLGIVLFTFGFCTSAALLAFTMGCEVNKPIHVATALGMINMLIMLGNTLSLPLLGCLLDKFSSSVHGLHVYNLLSYKIAFSFILMLLMIPLILLFFIKETHAKNNSTH